MDRMSDVTASYLIGRADRIISTHLEAALQGSGLSLPEFTALSVLATRPGLSNARLARRSLVTPQAMHKVIRSLIVYTSTTVCASFMPALLCL